MITPIITGSGFLAGCILLLATWALIGAERDRRPVFTAELTEPADGICPCGAPKCTPQPAPFPGDEPVQPAAGPVPVPGYVAEAIGHGGDSDAWVESAWNRIQARELREKLRAEEAEEALS